MKRWLLLLALLLPDAWSQGQTGAGPDRIAGRVISALDGRPLPGATLSIAGTRDRRPVASVAAGEDGSFRFDGLKPGKYSLNCAARGYLAADYDQHEGFSSAIVTGVAGLDTGALELRLVPAATISGRVVDEAGEGVRNAQVMLWGRQPGSGTNQIRRLNGAQTDDRGEYTIGLVGPGTYFLSVQAAPWYAVHASGLKQPGQEFGVTGTLDPALDVVYPLTFYPGATNSDDATPIPVKGGEEVAIDLHLVPQQALRLTFHAGQGTRGVQLMSKVFDEFDPAPVAMSIANDEAEMYGLVPGRYEVRLMGQNGATAARGAMMDLTQSQSMELPALETTGELKLVVEMEGGGKLPSPVMVALAHIGGTGLNRMNLGATMTGNEHGEVEFREIQPGEYRPVVYGQSTLHVVRPATVKVAAGEPATVKVVVSQTAMNVEGVAKQGEQGLSGAMVVMAPVDRPGELELYRRDQSDLDGSFLLPNVFAGRYKVVAIRGGWGLEWGKPEALAPYLAKGMVVTIPGAGKGPIQLGTVAVQDR